MTLNAFDVEIESKIKLLYEKKTKKLWGSAVNDYKEYFVNGVRKLIIFLLKLFKLF